MLRSICRLSNNLSNCQSRRFLSKKYTATYGTTLIEKIVGKKIYKKYITDQISLGQLHKIYKEKLKEKK